MVLQLFRPRKSTTCWVVNSICHFQNLIFIQLTTLLLVGKQSPFFHRNHVPIWISQMQPRKTQSLHIKNKMNPTVITTLERHQFSYRNTINELYNFARENGPICLCIWADFLDAKLCWKFCSHKCIYLATQSLSHKIVVFNKLEHFSPQCSSISTFQGWEEVNHVNVHHETHRWNIHDTATGSQMWYKIEICWYVNNK